MTNENILSYEFVEHIPECIEEGRLYVSLKYATVAHACCCGCRKEVITPLSPTDWKLIYDGESISLYPSIGNWSLACRSHYWIRNSKVVWAPQWSREEIQAGRDYAYVAKNQYYEGGADSATQGAQTSNQGRGMWGYLMAFFSRNTPHTGDNGRDIK